MELNNFFKALIAGWGASRLGGGCLGTIVVFVIIWWLLGQCTWFLPSFNYNKVNEISYHGGIH